MCFHIHYRAVAGRCGHFLKTMEMLKMEQVVGNETDTVSDSLEIYKLENLQCFECFITFSDPKAKERHMRKTHGELYKQHLQLSDTKFSCYKCEKYFSTSGELSEHTASHKNDEKSFQCPYCGETFYTFTEVTKHRRWDCDKRHCPCKDCGALFPNPSRLHYHRMKMHTQRPEVADEDTTHKCWKCNRTFQTEEDLLEHQEKFADSTNCEFRPSGKKRGRKPKNEASGELIDKKVKIEEDTGEYSNAMADECLVKEEKVELEIPCPEADCDLVFPSVDALRAHKREQHGRSSRKTHACQECDESYAQLEQLTLHIAKAHCSVEYACPTCGDSFSEEKVLIDHLSSHCKKEEPAQ